MGLNSSLGLRSSIAIVLTILTTDLSSRGINALVAFPLPGNLTRLVHRNPSKRESPVGLLLGERIVRPADVPLVEAVWVAPFPLAVLRVCDPRLLVVVPDVDPATALTPPLCRGYDFAHISPHSVETLEYSEDSQQIKVHSCPLAAMAFDTESDSVLVEFVCVFLLLSALYHVLSGLATLFTEWGGQRSLVMFGFLGFVLGVALVVSTLGLLFRGGTDWLVATSSTIVFLLLLDLLGFMLAGSVALVVDFLILLVASVVLVRHRTSTTSARSGIDEDSNVHSIGRDYP